MVGSDGCQVVSDTGMNCVLGVSEACWCPQTGATPLWQKLSEPSLPALLAVWYAVVPAVTVVCSGTPSLVTVTRH